MADRITNYQCPACTGPLQFAARSGKLECEYCESKFELSEIEAMYPGGAAEPTKPEDNAQWDTSSMTEDWGEAANGMRSYNCPSCGAELICDETTAATACPYCGNPSIVEGQFSGAWKPDYVLPFKLTKEQAIEALKAHYKGKKFLPDTFLDRHTIDKIQGVYVPFWLYDGTAEGMLHWHGTHTRIYREGPEWEVTETDHYRIERSGSMSFEKVPVDASKKMPDDYMDSIEPFDYRELKPFSAAYLPGFLADKYDVDVEQGHRRADQRCIRSFEDTMESTVHGFGTLNRLPSSWTVLHRGAVHYALLPVWLLNVKWNDQIHLFAINGQTGRTVGRLPACKKKAMIYFAKFAVPFAILGAWLATVLVG